MSDKGKELQLKYPGGRYHDIIVTNYLSIDHNNGELLIIFYQQRYERIVWGESRC